MHVYLVSLDGFESVHESPESALAWARHHDPELTMTQLADDKWGFYQSGRHSPVGTVREHVVLRYA